MKKNVKIKKTPKKKKTPQNPKVFFNSKGRVTKGDLQVMGNFMALIVFSCGCTDLQTCQVVCIIYIQLFICQPYSILFKKLSKEFLNFLRNVI